MVMSNLNLKFEHVINITKIKGEMHVPKISNRFKFKNGVYLWVYEGKVVKVGIFGEGVKSNSLSRYSTYRTVAKNLFKYISGEKKSNGSVKPMQVLSEKLKNNEKIEVHFTQLPDDIIDHGGLPYSLNLYILEQFYKDKHKHNLWLS